MHFSQITLAASFCAMVMAAPLAHYNENFVVPTPTINERDLTQLSYNELSISSGVAGNAQAEALARFPVPSDLSTVSASDLEIIETEREAAEDAETDAFNPAIDAASGDEATALQNGKIKNKVLKLTGEVLALQIEQAQGEDNADKIAEEQTKLDTNIALDKAAAGQVSEAVPFSE